MRYQSLAEMFFKKKEERPDYTAYQYKKGAKWHSVTFEVAVQQVESLAAGLAALDVKKGDRVALMSPNRIEWAFSDYAAMALGAVLVPIYPSLLGEQVQYILNDSQAKVLLVSDSVQSEKVEGVIKQLTHTKHFYILDSEGEDINDSWKSFQALLEDGRRFLEEQPEYVRQQVQSVKADDWATIIYTSGTTGEPKGAILTHKNFLYNIEDATSVLPVMPEDTFLSFLPLSHIFERMAGHYLSCYHGCMVAYAESIDTVAENLLEIRPSVMISVPRLYEKIYGRVLESVEAGSPIKRKLFFWSIKIGRQYIKHVMDKTSMPVSLKMKRNLAYKLVFKKLSQRVGGRIRFFVSGGAPLSPEIAEFFGAAGLLILEGYGLTETSPVIAVNRLESFRFGTVGPPLPGIEVKIAEDGEILTRGEHVMVGYYNKEADTNEVIDKEGWLHTGDIGIIENDFLRITDRKKNIIVTSGGKNIAPQPIENNLINSKYIEQAMVIGDKRKYCTAVIVPAQEALSKWANDNNFDMSDYNQFVNSSEVRKLIRSEIDAQTKNLASYETIKNFIFASEPFSIENEQLTPSLKTKRHVVAKVYADAIDRMYAEA